MSKPAAVINVLFVDGSSTSRKLVTNKFKRIRPEVRIDTHAGISSAAPKLHAQAYDLVVVGFTLPDGNGLDFASKIRSPGPNEHTQIIMISGHAITVDDSQLYRAHGIDAHFDKSLGIDALIEYLDSLLPKPEAQALPARVLFIEDSRTVNAAISRMLTQHGIAFTEIETGEEAMALISNLRHTLDAEFDVMITDLNLTGEISGKDLVRHIRQDLGINKQALPILLAAGSREDELDYVELCELGINDFITKPVVQEILLARMEPWVLLKQHLHP